MSRCCIRHCQKVTCENVNFWCGGSFCSKPDNPALSHVALSRSSKTQRNQQQWPQDLSISAKKGYLVNFSILATQGDVLGPREPEEWLWIKKIHGMKWSSTWCPALSVQFSVSLHWKFKVTSHWGQAWTETSDSVKRNVRMRMNIIRWSPFLVEAFAP